MTTWSWHWPLRGFVWMTSSMQPRRSSLADLLISEIYSILYSMRQSKACFAADTNTTKCKNKCFVYFVSSAIKHLVCSCLKWCLWHDVVSECIFWRNGGATLMKWWNWQGLSNVRSTSVKRHQLMTLVTKQSFHDMAHFQSTAVAQPDHQSWCIIASFVAIDKGSPTQHVQSWYVAN